MVAAVQVLSQMCDVEKDCKQETNTEMSLGTYRLFLSTKVC
jgi:hypothetical protein